MTGHFSWVVAAGLLLCFSRAGWSAVSLGRSWPLLEQVKEGVAGEGGMKEERTVEKPHATEKGGFLLGLTANAGGLLARTASQNHTVGTSFGGGLFLSTSNPELQFQVGLGYHVLNLVRMVDLSGYIEEPNPTEFTNQLRVGCLSAAVAWRPFKSDALGSEFAGNLGWALGLQYAQPVAAVQVSSVGAETAYTSPDRFFFVGTGPSWHFKVVERIEGSLDLQYRYNMGSSRGAELTQVTLQAGLAFVI